VKTCLRMVSTVVLILLVGSAAVAMWPDTPAARADGLDPFCDAAAAPGAAGGPLSVGRPSFAGARLLAAGRDDAGHERSTTLAPTLLNLPIPALNGGSQHFYANRTNFAINPATSPEFSFSFGLRSSTAPPAGDAASGFVGPNPLQDLFTSNFGLGRDYARDFVGGAGLSLMVFHPMDAVNHQVAGDFGADVSVSDGTTTTHYRVTIGIDARPSVAGPGAVFPEASLVTLLFKRNTDPARPERGWWGVAEEFSYRDYPGSLDANRPPVKLSVRVEEVAVGAGSATVTTTLDAAQDWSKAPQDFAAGVSDQCTAVAAGTDPQTSRLTWVRPNGPADAAFRISARTGLGRGVRGADGFRADLAVSGVPRTLDVRFRQRQLLVDRSSDVVPTLRLDRIQSAALPPPGSPAPPEDPTVLSGEIVGLPEHTAVVAASTSLDRIEAYTCPTPGEAAMVAMSYGLVMPSAACSAGSPTAPERLRFGMANVTPEEEAAGPVHDAIAGFEPTPTGTTPYVTYQARSARTGDPAGTPSVSKVGAQLEHVRHVLVDRSGAPGGGSRISGWIETDGRPAASRPASVFIHSDDRTDGDDTRAVGSLVKVSATVGSLPRWAKFTAVTDPAGGHPFGVRWEAADPVHVEADVTYASGRRSPDDVDRIGARVVSGPGAEVPRLLEADFTDGPDGSTMRVHSDAAVRLRGRAVLSSFAERSASVARARLVRAETASDHLLLRWQASTRGGMEQVHAEACQPCADVVATRVSVAYATGSLERISPTPPAGTDPVDVLPDPLDVPATLSDGPNPAYTSLSPLGPDEEGLRAVSLVAKGGTDSDIRGTIAGIKSFDLDRRPPGGDPSAERDMKACLVSSPTGRPFRVGMFVETADPLGAGPPSGVHVDGSISRMPETLAAVVAESRWIATGRSDAYLLRLGTDGCDPASWSYGDAPDDPRERPKVEVAVRSAVHDAEGLAHLRDAAPVRGRGAARREGIDAVVVSGTAHRTVDVVARLTLARILEVRTPAMDTCDAASAGSRPEPWSPCPEPVQERRDRTRIWLDWGSSLRTLGSIDVLVRQPGPDARFDRGRWLGGADTDTTAAVDAVPGSATLYGDLSENVRVPWREMRVELWPTAKYNKATVPLESATVDYRDQLHPGYLGPWYPTRDEYDERNLMSNYHVRLRGLGDRLRVTASIVVPEQAPGDNGPSDPRDEGRAWCASQGAGPDPRRESGVAYVDADVDMRGSPELEVRVRRNDDPTDDRSADTAVSFDAGWPVQATVRAKVSMQQFMRKSDMGWLNVFPVGTTDVAACVDVDLPLELTLNDLHRADLFQSGMQVKADLPVLEALTATVAGRDPLTGRLGERYWQPGSAEQRDDPGAWYRVYRALFDPAGVGMWDATATQTYQCTQFWVSCRTRTGTGRVVGGMPGVRRDAVFRPVAPVPGTADDCDTDDLWTDDCTLPRGELRLHDDGFTNVIGFQPRGDRATDLRTPGVPWEIDFLADVVFDNDSVHQMADSPAIFGTGAVAVYPTVGQRLYEGLRRMSDIDGISSTPPILLRDQPRPATTFGAGQTVCGDWNHRGPGSTQGARQVLDDGTTLEAWFQDECYATTVYTGALILLPNWSRWTVLPSMQLVARFPDGSIRWTRTLVANGELEAHETEAIWHWQSAYSNPPDDRHEYVRIAVDPEGTSAQVQAFVEDDDDGVILDRIFRFDASGAGGPVRADRRLAVDTSIPFWRVTADPARIAGVASHTPSTVAVSEPLPPCTPPGCSRTVFFGDGTFERRDGRDGRPGPEVTGITHTWHGTGSYVALVVTYDSSGRAFDALPVRIRAG